MTVDEAVRDVLAELDPDGGGYRSSEAAEALLRLAEAEQGATLKQLARSLARRGATVSLKDHRAEGQAHQRAASSGFRSFADTQTDFADVAGDAFAWTAQYTALDETHEAVRKRVEMLTYAECLRVIALKQRKASEAAAMAKRLQNVVDEHPGWAASPELTLEEVLDGAAD